MTLAPAAARADGPRHPLDRDSIEPICREVGALLAAMQRRVVFAESCTAGLASALLAGLPGISQFLCGSAVTYREATKTEWLAVPAQTLARHSAVSPEVTRQMALNVLARTSEADLAAAVTGHLGPGAPPEQDGCILIAVARREMLGKPADLVAVAEHRLASTCRVDRQREAAVRVLEAVRQVLAEESAAQQHARHAAE